MGATHQRSTGYRAGNNKSLNDSKWRKLQGLDAKSLRSLKNIKAAPQRVPGGELTPTLKLVRPTILKKYSNIIDAMYEGARK